MPTAATAANSHLNPGRFRIGAQKVRKVGRRQAITRIRKQQRESCARLKSRIRPRNFSRRYALRMFSMSPYRTSRLAASALDTLESHRRCLCRGPCRDGYRGDALRCAVAQEQHRTGARAGEPDCRPECRTRQRRNQRDIGQSAERLAHRHRTTRRTCRRGAGPAPTDLRSHRGEEHHIREGLPVRSPPQGRRRIEDSAEHARSVQKEGKA